MLSLDEPLLIASKRVRLSHLNFIFFLERVGAPHHTAEENWYKLFSPEVWNPHGTSHKQAIDLLFIGASVGKSNILRVLLRLTGMMKQN